MMDTKEALKELEDLTVDYGNRNEEQIARLDEAIDMAMEALRAQAEHTGKRTETHSCDCISRQAAIAEIARWIGYVDEDMILRIQTGVKMLPSAQPEVLACGEGELSAQPEPPWIPCSKELPERNRVVLVTTKWDEVTEGVKLSGDAWFIGRGEENAFDSDIIAWMPKPEPYKEEPKKCDTCQHEKEPWSMHCHSCDGFKLWEAKQ